MTTDTLIKRGHLGGGGYVCSLDISSDGLTRVHKTDVSPGGYVWKNPSNLDATDASGTNPAFEWVPFLNEASMAAENNRTPGNFLRGNWGAGYGCHWIGFAPSNPAVIYMVGPCFAGTKNWIFKSTDRGKTVTRVGLAGGTNSSSGLGQPDSRRMWGPKGGVNPNNPDHFIFTVTYNSSQFPSATNTDGGGLRQSLDGGVTVTTISTFPASTGTADEMASTSVCWDPVTADLVYAFRQNDGLYKSTNSGTDWDRVAGGPRHCRRMTVDKFGQVWVGDYSVTSNELWRLDGSAWTATNPAPRYGDSLDQPACNPLSTSKATNQISTCGDSGAISHSYDNGATWTDAYRSAPLRVATDLLWLAETNEYYMTSGGLAYDTQALTGFPRGRLWFYEGIGLWYGQPLATSARPTWTELTRGNEELIVTLGMKPPGTSLFFFGFHDRSVFALDGTTPPLQLVVEPGSSLQHVYGGRGMDYAGQNPSNLAFATSIPFGIYYCTDKGAGGRSSVFKTESHPHNANSVNNWSVQISASGVSNMISTGANASVKYTTNTGSSWAASVFSGTAPTETNPEIISDKVVPGVFWAKFLTQGLWKSVDGGKTFSPVSPGRQDFAYGSMFADCWVANVLWLYWNQQGYSGVDRPGYNHPYAAGGGKLILKSTDGGANWTSPRGSAVFEETHAMSFGKEAPTPGSPKTCYVLGVKPGDLPSVYRSTDNLATWAKIDGPLGETSIGTYDAAVALVADPDTYGKFMLGMKSTGVRLGTLRAAGVNKAFRSTW